VRARHHGRRRAHRVGELVEGHDADGRAALARGDERADQAGVLLVGGEDLVALGDAQGGEGAGHALAGRRRQRHVVLGGAQHAGVAGP